MSSRFTRGRNGGAPPQKWYGALCQQMPLGRWMAYVYDLNRKEVVWRRFFDTAENAKQALDLYALGLHGNPTNLNFSVLAAAAAAPISGGYSDPGYTRWESGDEHESQGPEYIFWQGGADTDGPNPQFRHWQHGN